jgi:hypothetical protein
MDTIDQAENTSSSATLMKRYEAPQKALRRRSRTMDRRDICIEVRRTSN